MASEKIAFHRDGLQNIPSTPRSSWLSQHVSPRSALFVGVFLGCALGNWLPRLQCTPGRLLQSPASTDNHLITACYPPLPAAYDEGITAEEIKRELDHSTQHSRSHSPNPFHLIEHGIHGGSLTSAAISVFTISDEDEDSSGVVIDRGFGVQRGNDTDGGVVNANTIYRLASVTKVFVALQLLVQEKAGLLDLDADISTYLPRFRVSDETWSSRLGWTNNSRSSHAPITPRQLISHFAGLKRDRNVEFSKWPFLLTEEELDQINLPDYGLDDLYNDTSDTPYVVGPWTFPVYSNVGFNFAGLVAAAVDPNNSTFEDLLHETIFQPLGMKSSFFAPRTEEQSLRIAIPAAPLSGEADEDMGVENPSGAMYASVRDLRRFVQSLLAPSRQKGALLSPDEVRRWLQPMHIFDDGRSAVGMPWEIVHLDMSNDHHDLWSQAPNRRSLTLYTKGGNLQGYHTMMMIEPQRKLGAIFLSTASQPVPQLEMPLEAFQPVVKAWDRVRERRWRKLYTGHFGDSYSQNHVSISYESRALFVDKLIIHGKDILHSFNITDPVRRTSHHDRAVERVALWPTDEPDIFRLAIGRGKPKPLAGCEEIWASWDGLGYSNEFPTDLVAIRNATLHIPAANITLRRRG